MPRTLPRPDQDLAHFPESSALRSAYWDSFFEAPQAELGRRSPGIVSNEEGDFLLSSTTAGGYFYTILTALRQPYAKGSQPPIDSQGSWVLKRSEPEGSPIQAKVFLRSDPNTFLRIYPDGDRAKLDLVVYGGVINHDVPLPADFEHVFKSSLADIMSWTSGLVDWSLFSPQPGRYGQVEAFVEKTRGQLKNLRYGDDGALDASGKPVYIATGLPQNPPYGLNCSGFAAWLADGFYRPMTGQLLDPLALASRHAAARPSLGAARYEELLDPYFGLDWTRNIAKTLLDARETARQHDLFESDVRISAFAMVVSGDRSLAAYNGSSAYRDFPAYQRDMGYQASGLEALLYVLAIREPGNIYFASISGRNGKLVPGLNRHYHVAVFAPYFDERGEFRVASFESCAETSVEAVMGRLKDSYIHLVRVRAQDSFDPPAVSLNG